MKQSRVLDPTHVLGVCAHSIQYSGADPARIDGTVAGDSVTVRIANEKARTAAVQALQESGYLVLTEGEAITVRGWSGPHLAQRVTALDNAVRWLQDKLSTAARDATEMYEDTARQFNLTGRPARNLARTRIIDRLHRLVQLQAGPLLWQDPAVQPTDPKTALLLRECRWLEDEADLLLSRHRAVATQAIAEHRTEMARQRPDAAPAVASIAAPAAEIASTPAPTGRPELPEPPSTPHRGRSA